MGTDSAQVDVAGIAKGLTPHERRSWADAEWQGEYYSPPALYGADWCAAKRMTLVAGPDCVDGHVLPAGDRLIAHLAAQVQA